MKPTVFSLALSATLPIFSHAGVILSDTFSYPDGPLVTVSGGKWSTHSGSPAQVDVAGGMIHLTQAESEDVNASLDGQPYGPSSGVNLYARFVVNFSSLPSGDGTYFAHFKDNTATGFRCKVFATTNGAAPGSFRLGIAAAANTPTSFSATNLPAGLAVSASTGVISATSPTAAAGQYTITVTAANGRIQDGLAIEDGQGC